MTLNTNTILLVGVIVVAVCAVVIVVLALWDLGRTWWTPEDTIVERDREHRWWLL